VLDEGAYSFTNMVKILGKWCGAMKRIKIMRHCPCKNG